MKKKITQHHWDAIFKKQYAHGTFKTVDDILKWMDSKFEVQENTSKFEVKTENMVRVVVGDTTFEAKDKDDLIKQLAVTVKAYQEMHDITSKKQVSKPMDAEFEAHCEAECEAEREAELSAWREEERRNEAGWFAHGHDQEPF